MEAKRLLQGWSFLSTAAGAMGTLLLIASVRGAEGWMEAQPVDRDRWWLRPLLQLVIDIGRTMENLLFFLWARGPLCFFFYSLDTISSRRLLFAHRFF